MLRRHGAAEALERCPGLAGKRFELQIVGDQGVRLAKGLPDLVQSSARGAGYYLAICKGDALSADAACTNGEFNTAHRDHLNAMQNRHRARIAAEQQRQRQEAEARRQALLQAAREAYGQKVGEEQARWTAHMERVLADPKAWVNLAGTRPAGASSRGARTLHAGRRNSHPIEATPGQRVPGACASPEPGSGAFESA